MKRNINLNEGGARTRSVMLFGVDAGGQRTVIGPAQGFRAVGASLRREPDGREVAVFEANGWRVRNARRHFSILWTDADIYLTLDDPARGSTLRAGPFDMIGVVENTIHVNREQSRPLIHFDISCGAWRSVEDNRYWPELSLLAAPSTADSSELLIRTLLRA